MTTILTIKGVVEPVQLNTSNGTYGIDFGGYFGPAGASLAGAEFTVTWTGTPCNCSSPYAFPVSSAILTINNNSYSFGSDYGNEWFPYLQQVQSNDPDFTSLTTDLYQARGVFYLHVGPASQWEQAFLHIISVPGPIAGAGLPALLLAVAILAWWKRSHA
jgi:hypothetical protein